MKDKKKLKLKKFYINPVIGFILLSFIVVIISGVLSFFEVGASYSVINNASNQVETVMVTVENLLSFDGLKYIISNAARNFVSFTPLSTLLISLIGVAIAQATGFFEIFIKKSSTKMNPKIVTFILIFIATISSLINEVGYVILIPLGAILFQVNGRNPLAGIVASFAACAFGAGVTVFVGSMEATINPITAEAAHLIDAGVHISLTSNILGIIITSIIISIVGTIIIEKIIVKKLGKYKFNPEEPTEQLAIIDVEEEEQKKLDRELREKRGLRAALITGIVVLLLFIYCLIPNLPFSGLLLDMNEVTYLNQLFGPNAYFQDAFTYLISIFLAAVGVAYGIGARTVTSTNDLFKNANDHMKVVGELVILIFFASQFIAIFKRTNIGVVLTALGGNLINSLSFSGLPLVILSLLIIALSGLFITTPVQKWAILAPVIVPNLMQSNVSPQFAQFLLRVGDSMTKGITPLLAFFAIYLGYLNIYNLNKDKPITIGASLKLVMPYFAIISLAWICIVVVWYLIGLPLAPNIFPTI